MERVVVALSGGVDSSVAAYLLREAGYDVVALFMRNWDDTTGTLSGDCPWYDDRLFAEMVARRLDIPLHTVNFVEEYGRRVVDYLFDEYAHGRTPNPDVLCNREIKFDLFLREAERLGADRIATGHYCRVTHEGGINRLRAGVDPNKDQSYFLCQLGQRQLDRVLFPVGELTKPEVRRIAAEQQLATARRKDSQGICFVGKVDLPRFLAQRLKPRPGPVIEIAPDWPGYAPLPAGLPAEAEPTRYRPEDGQAIGTHNGAHYYTVGQRKGLGIGGRKESLFVLATDVKHDVVYVGMGDGHPGLWRRALRIAPDEVHWVRPDRAPSPGTAMRCTARIRYRQPLEAATLDSRPEGLYLRFDRPQRGIAAGQFAVWYDGDEVLGSGPITR